MVYYGRGYTIIYVLSNKAVGRCVTCGVTQSYPQGGGLNRGSQTPSRLGFYHLHSPLPPGREVTPRYAAPGDTRPSDATDCRLQGDPQVRRLSPSGGRRLRRVCHRKWRQAHRQR